MSSRVSTSARAAHSTSRRLSARTRRRISSHGACRRRLGAIAPACRTALGSRMAFSCRFTSRALAACAYAVSRTCMATSPCSCVPRSVLHSGLANVPWVHGKETTLNPDPERALAHECGMDSDVDDSRVAQAAGLAAPRRRALSMFSFSLCVVRYVVSHYTYRTIRAGAKIEGTYEL